MDFEETLPNQFFYKEITQMRLVLLRLRGWFLTLCDCQAYISALILAKHKQQIKHNVYTVYVSHTWLSLIEPLP